MPRYANLRPDHCVYLWLMERNAKSWAQRKHAFIQGQRLSEIFTLQLQIIYLLINVLKVLRFLLIYIFLYFIISI